MLLTGSLDHPLCRGRPNRRLVFATLWHSRSGDVLIGGNGYILDHTSCVTNWRCRRSITTGLGRRLGTPAAG